MLLRLVAAGAASDGGRRAVQPVAGGAVLAVELLAARTGRRRRGREEHAEGDEHGLHRAEHPRLTVAEMPSSRTTQRKMDVRDERARWRGSGCGRAPVVLVARLARPAQHRNGRRARGEDDDPGRGHQRRAARDRSGPRARRPPGCRSPARCRSRAVLGGHGREPGEEAEPLEHAEPPQGHIRAEKRVRYDDDRERVDGVPVPGDRLRRRARYVVRPGRASPGARR